MKKNRTEFEKLYSKLRDGNVNAPETRVEIKRKQPKLPGLDGIIKPIKQINKNEFILNPRLVTKRIISPLKKQAK